jgi:hypothetical protein
MDLTWLQPAVDRAGPFTTVNLDATRDTGGADRAVELRWQHIRRQLESEGAPKSVVERLEDVALTPSRAPGTHGRTLVATDDEVVVDRVLPRPPLRDSGHYGLVPHLMPLVRALDGAFPYAAVEVDRAGAEITVVEPLGDGTRERTTSETVEGGHDVLHPGPGGGWSHRRYRSRVQDSWERNAAAVAEEVDRVVARHHPELLLLTGDSKAAALLTERLGRQARELVVRIEGGGRAEGTDAEAFAQHVEEVLTRHRQQHMGDVLARYTQLAGQGHRAASGLAAVVDALRAGSVEVLLLHDEPSSDLTLWAGENPLHLGRTREEVEALGAREIVEDRADAVLLRALVAQGGSVELVDPADVLAGGVGAILRYDIRPPVPGAGG